MSQNCDMNGPIENLPSGHQVLQLPQAVQMRVQQCQVTRCLHAPIIRITCRCSTRMNMPLTVSITLRTNILYVGSQPLNPITLLSEKRRVKKAELTRESFLYCGVS